MARGIDGAARDSSSHERCLAPRSHRSEQGIIKNNIRFLLFLQLLLPKDLSSAPAYSSFLAMKEEAYDGISAVTTTRNDAKRNYNRMSGFYDLMTASSERHFTKAGLLQLHAQPGETVLDIGCGTGFAVARIAEKVGTDGRVEGIDLSEGMLQKARERLRNEKIPDGIVNLQVGDAAKLPFDDNTFDAILMSFVLELFDTPEIPEVLAEAKRVVKVGGRITVVALAKYPDKLAVKVYEWFHDKMPSFVDCRPIKVDLALMDARLELCVLSQQEMWGLPVKVATAVKLANEEADWRPPIFPQANMSWQEGNENETHCCLCQCTFVPLWRQRHHCRCCARAVCHSCSDQTLAFSGPSETYERVCNECTQWNNLWCNLHSRQKD